MSACDLYVCIYVHIYIYACKCVCVCVFNSCFHPKIAVSWYSLNDKDDDYCDDDNDDDMCLRMLTSHNAT